MANETPALDRLAEAVKEFGGIENFIPGQEWQRVRLGLLEDALLEVHELIKHARIKAIRD